MISSVMRVDLGIMRSASCGQLGQHVIYQMTDAAASPGEFVIQ
jgi:hypothetical protein